MRSYPFRWVLLSGYWSTRSHCIDPRDRARTLCGKSTSGSVVIGRAPITPCIDCAALAFELAADS